MESSPVIVDATELIAVLSPTEGNQTTGVVTFKPVEKGKVEIEATANRAASKLNNMLFISTNTVT